MVPIYINILYFNSCLTNNFSYHSLTKMALICKLMEFLISNNNIIHRINFTFRTTILDVFSYYIYPLSLFPSSPIFIFKIQLYCHQNNHYRFRGDRVVEYLWLLYHFSIHTLRSSLPNARAI